MNKELKDAWVAALRSGEYAQGIGALRRRHDTGPDGFCCLGVLVDVCVKRGWYPFDWVPPSETNTYAINTGNDGTHTAFLPEAIEQMAQLKQNEIQMLIHYNDSNQAPFSFIAQWIEATL